MGTALLVVDMQASLVADETPNAAEILDAVQQSVARARDAGAVVVWVTDRRVQPDPSLHSDLVPVTGDLHVVKEVRSAFEGTGLKDELDVRGVDHVAICGMQSDACMDGTTRAASDFGYRVTLIADAHTTHDFEGRDYRKVIAEQNAVLGRLAGVSVLPSARVDFG